MPDLARFADAQEGVYENACAELRAGRKRSHWMWFIFPQLRGLGASAMARTYGIASRAEAAAYLADPLLGPRLVAVFEIVLGHADLSLREIFGTPDDLKFRSFATLFAALPDAPPVFAKALARFCEARPDPRTLALLAETG
jgi:uncharacterized protein (DUF1810 family)